MSCMDVMYHQGYGTHRYLPETSAAADYHYQQQHQRLCFQGKMESRVEVSVQPAKGEQPEPRAAEREESPEEEKGGVGDGGAVEKEARPAEAQYLSSSCVLFTYFQGDIGDVVDEHFSRALSQSGTLPSNGHSIRTPSGGLQRAGSASSSGQCADFPSSLWSSGYPSQSGTCLSSIRPDLSPGAIFHSVEHGVWLGRGLTPPPLSDCWPYGLGAQSSATYARAHEDYPHVHPHRTNHAVHRTFGSRPDPRLPSVCPPSSPAAHGEISKSETGSSSNPIHSWNISPQESMDYTYELRK